MLTAASSSGSAWFEEFVASCEVAAGEASGIAPPVTFEEFGVVTDDDTLAVEKMDILGCRVMRRGVSLLLLALARLTPFTYKTTTTAITFRFFFNKMNSKPY